MPYANYEQRIAELESAVDLERVRVVMENGKLRLQLAESQAREAKLLDDIDRRLECAGITIYSGRPQRDDTALKEAIKQAKREAYKAGYGRGHNDTVEGCYNSACEFEDECADDWMAEG